MYYRYHVSYVSPKTSMPVGITVAVWHLLKAGLFSAEEEAEYYQRAEHLKKILPVPSFYDDENSVGAVTWFKTSKQAESIVEQMQFYFDMMSKYGEPIVRTETDSPGTIIYEDAFQIGAV